jgi:LPXTG-site transpeptidase (sortase) family protein
LEDINIKVLKNKKIFLIIFVIGLISICIPTLFSYEKDNLNKKLVKKYLTETSFDYRDQENNILSLKDNYSFVLEIPKIELKKGIYDINYKSNSIKYNIEILEGSVFPIKDGTSIILASHSGSSNISYFKNLNKLEIGDSIYIYYDGVKYIYQVALLFEQKSSENLVIKDDDKTKLFLITCKDDNKKLIVKSFLVNREYY